jgi:hypothetical protein
VTELDANFSGTSGTGLPEADLDFSCKDGGVTNPEVVVDVKQDTLPDDPEAAAAAQIGFDTQDEAWIRIPVTGVEQWINKDGPADITRTAKVHFPYEWGNHTILQYINGFNSQNNLADQADPYDECRIFFYDHDIDQWVQAHYGYVGGIGPAAESTGVGKFWVYDPADLMKGIQVSKSFTEPSIASVIDFALRGIDDQGDIVGLERRSVFDGLIGHTILGESNIPQAKEENVTGQGVGELTNIGALGFEGDDVVEDTFERALDTVSRAATESQKRFQLNRHNMVDVMDWFVNLLDGRWWFEPGPESPTLVVDASAYKEGPEDGDFDRRYFVDRAAVDDWSDIQIQLRKQAYIQQEFDFSQDNLLEQAEQIGETVNTEFNGEEVTLDFSAKQLIENGDVEANVLPPHNYNIFAQVETLNNSALADIKPFNTLYLYGESTTLRSKLDRFRDSAAPGMETAEFPWVKVTYPPLIERSGGFEYSAQPIESDKLFLQQAEQQARKEFRKHLAEQTEGEITLLGEPYILPYDYIVSLPTCNGTYENANANPITWEVNGVKHTRKAGERHKTKLGVSMTLEESLMRVESEYKEA